MTRRRGKMVTIPIRVTTTEEDYSARVMREINRQATIWLRANGLLDLDDEASIDSFDLVHDMKLDVSIPRNVIPKENR